jgi:hypothetical protein
MHYYAHLSCYDAFVLAAVTTGTIPTTTNATDAGE